MARQMRAAVMKASLSRALVPVLKKLPTRATQKPAQPKADAIEDAVVIDARSRDDFDLVRREMHLRNRVEVEKFLPDILGRALARIWIDPVFRTRFSLSPKGTLADYDVHLPETITIDFVTENVPRPQVVVYEQKPGGEKKRLLYLQLVMMAGR